MDAFQIGFLTIRYEWLYAAIAFTVTYFTLEHMTKKDKHIQKQVTETLLNSLLLWILTFKLSVIFFRPSIIFDNPLGIIFFWGGLKGQVLATFIALIYFIMKSKKLQWPNSLLLLVTYFVTFMLTYILIRTLFQLII
ncbi:hypothetical protein SAMN04488577_2480 [Bacillus sp. cl95]|nr:hypothetical protein SAMN02799634_102361 [Bacillus sp. UNCCL13]SFQ84764.1 hypothetical protein SAMN04488577_2480 [Bacillus sp. cl95]